MCGENLFKIITLEHILYICFIIVATSRPSRPDSVCVLSYWSYTLYMLYNGCDLATRLCVYLTCMFSTLNLFHNSCHLYSIIHTFQSFNSCFDIVWSRISVDRQMELRATKMNCMNFVSVDRQIELKMHSMNFISVDRQIELVCLPSFHI